MTAAQNGGRLASYDTAEKMGIKLKKEWMATLDAKTRDSHAALDGEVVEKDKPFSNGLRYPGDPSGRPAEVYNCRCTMVAALDGYKYAKTYIAPNGEQAEYRSYKEWQAGKLAQGNVYVVNSAGMSYNTDTETRQMANGMRTSQYHTLTEKEIDSILEDANALKIDPQILVFNDFVNSSNTGYSELDDIIYIRGDILPDTNSIIARDLISQRGVLAHEYYGHKANAPSEYRIGDYRDEFRASYDAAINAPNLTDKDRKYLMIDAYDRLKEAGAFEGYSEEARKIIYGS